MSDTTTTREATATIRGRPEYPSITEINVRSGPGTNHAIVFKGAVGTAGLAVLDVAPDAENTTADNGKLFQWFQLRFSDGATAWVRDDLLEVEGDLTDFGYGVVASLTFAFDLARSAPPAAKPEKPEAKAVEKPAPKSAPLPVAGDNIQRVQTAALAITAAFEGEGYAAYNNYDSGIVSYGLIQFTLAAGTLGVVMNNYLAHSNSAVANGLRAFQGRVAAADPGLRHDETFKTLLIQAADELEMRAAQNSLAIANYWDRLMDSYVKPRGFVLPLTYALLFDISVNFGVGDGFVRMAEERLGVPTRSRVGEHGVTEEQIMAVVADLRKISHDKQAARDNLPGLRVRGDFWVDLVTRGDWQLQGDEGGFVNVNGRNVQVRKP